MDNQIMNMAITVDDGSRRVPIMNTRGEEIGAFTFRPTDIGIVGRYNAMVERFDSVTEPLQALAGEDGEALALEDPRYAAAIDEATRRVYAEVDALFGSDDAAQGFFGRMNPFSPVRRGHQRLPDPVRGQLRGRQGQGQVHPRPGQHPGELGGGRLKRLWRGTCFPRQGHPFDGFA